MPQIYHVLSPQDQWAWFLYTFCQPWRDKVAGCHREYWYRHLHGEYRFSSNEQKACILNVVQRLYILGRDLYKIPLDYDQFYNWFVHDDWFYDRKEKASWVSKKKNRKYCKGPKRSWRIKKKFVRQEHHTKKEISFEESQRREWRAKKKDREYRRKTGGYGYGYNKHVREKANPHCRARTKMLLKHERYDEIYEEYDKCYWKSILWMYL